VSGVLSVGSARATELGPAFDLLAAYEPPGGFFFERDGLGVASGNGGVAITASGLPELAIRVASALEGICGQASSPAPVAVGALPFAPEAPIELTVPVRVVRRTAGGRTWLVEVQGADGPAPPPFEPQRVRGSLPHDAFLPVQLHERPSSDAWAHAVATAAGRVRAGFLDKVVLARTVRVDADRRLDPRRLLHRLRAVEPLGHTFAAPVPPGAAPVPPGAAAALVGASPELLLARHGAQVRSTPLAGTAPRSGDPEQDRAHAAALMSSSKNREEHAIVVQAVAETLRRFCEDLSHDPEPVLLPTANVWHLATRFRGTLRDPTTTALDIVTELHPTPAVCGSPRDAARSVIAELEPFDRGHYAGPVGWVDASGDGVWAIALRCALLEGDRATLFSGAGIVAGSEPAQELDETDRKFRAFLDSLRWG
jgi:isochorismate synthase